MNWEHAFSVAVHGPSKLSYPNNYDSGDQLTTDQTFCDHSQAESRTRSLRPARFKSIETDSLQTLGAIEDAARESYLSMWYKVLKTNIDSTAAKDTQESAACAKTAGEALARWWNATSALYTYVERAAQRQISADSIPDYDSVRRLMVGEFKDTQIASSLDLYWLLVEGLQERIKKKPEDIAKLNAGGAAGYGLGEVITHAGSEIRRSLWIWESQEKGKTPIPTVAPHDT